VLKIPIFAYKFCRHSANWLKFCSLYINFSKFVDVVFVNMYANFRTGRFFR